MPAPDRGAVVRIALIRFATLLGVLLFGAICWWLRDSARATPAPNVDFFSRLGIVPAVIVAAAVLAIVVIRVLWSRASGPAARRQLAIVALAPGEAAALFGAVGYFNSGDPKWYFYGVFVLLASFLLFPIREVK